MTDTETTEQTTELEEEISKPKQGFSILPFVVVISLLLALAAGAGTGYMWFTAQQLQSAQTRTISDLNSQIAGLKQTQQQIQTNTASKQSALSQQQQEMTKRLSQIKEKLGRNRYDWAVAEIRYTLRQANMRLQLFKDKETSLIALQLADERLARLAAPALHKVRGVVKEEIAALRAVKEIDLEGVSLNLTALAMQVKQLSIKELGKIKPVEVLKQPLPENSTELAEWKKHADAIWSEMKTLVTIRRSDKKIVPLLGEQESQQIRQALRLKIEIARLALLQNDTQLFSASLQEANDWLAEYFNADQPAVIAITTELQSLSKLQLEPEYPDISRSLAMLEQVKNGMVKQASPAKSKEKKAQ